MKINILQVLLNQYQRRRSSLFTIRQIARVIEIKPRLSSEEVQAIKALELEKAADIAQAMDFYERGLQP